MPQTPSIRASLALVPWALALGCGNPGDVPQPAAHSGAGGGDDDASDDTTPGDDTTPDDDSVAGDDTTPGPEGALSATPSPLLLGVADSRALALGVDGEAIAGSDAAWSIDSPAVATVSAEGVVTGVALGATALTVAWHGQEVVVPVEVATLEARGIWLTRWSIAGAGGEEGLRALLADIAGAGFNQVYFQVRGSFDALYPSALEPWSSVLGGLGEDPGWDPLQVAVDECHARGLELHAYLNTFPFWSGTSPPAAVVPSHPYTGHPDWRVADGSGTPMALNSSYVYASPGNPEVREWVGAIARDIVERYDVDGIHLDYVRYPGSEYSHDEVSEAEYQAALVGEPGLSWTQFERDNVVATVAEVSSQVWAFRPAAKVTCAVWGIYQNTFGWSGVSQGLIDYYQDSGAFLSTGAADANCPMIYWELTHPEGGTLDWRTLARDHLDRAEAAGRHLYAGVYADYDDFSEIANEIQAARDMGAAGTVVFDYSYLVAHGFLDDLAAGPYALTARVPPMPWKGE